MSVATIPRVPGLEHLGVDHHGVPLDGLAVACLGITASAAVAVAVLDAPTGATWGRPANCAGPAMVIATLLPVPPFRAGPIELRALRL